MRDERVIVYCSTRDGYVHMTASAKSAIAHHAADKIFFLTEDDEFPDTLPPFIHNLNVSNQTFFDHSGPNYSSKWTYMVLMRLAIPKILHYNRILSLDIDTIITDDISPLWKLNLSNHYFAMVRENFPGRKYYPVKPYHNFGVTLMNIPKLRNECMDDNLINAVNTIKYAYNEQDAVNILCYGKILSIPEEYNAMPLNEPTVPLGQERIRHFVFQKPLRQHQIYRRYADMSWNDALTKGGYT